MRRRVFLSALVPAGKKIVFVTGDDEYRSEYTMPALSRILETHHGLRTTVCFAQPAPRFNKSIEGLEALADAALAVFFLRWRELPEAQLRMILDYVDSGRPVAGFRTSTHSFQYPAGHPRAGENDGFPLRVFGAKWTRHHGHMSTTRTVKASDHGVLNGVNPEMSLPSWLYSVKPLTGNCTPVLTGHAVNPQAGRNDGPQPVAWVKLNGRTRVFFSTMGHPEDFRNDDFRRLAVNGILWAAGLAVPKSGARVDFVGPYDPPPSGFLK